MQGNEAVEIFMEAEVIPIDDLTISENQRLDQLENIVSTNLRAFYEVGTALHEIRDSRLYRNEHETFEDYCRDRWDIGRDYADRLITSSAVMDNIDADNCQQKPMTESQTRPLTRLSAPLQIEAWEKAVETAPEGKITAKHVNNVVLEIEGKEVKRQTRTAREKINKEDLISEAFKLAFDEFYREVQGARLEHWKETSKEAAALSLEMLSALVTASQS